MARRRHPMNALFARVHEQLTSFLASRATLMRWLATAEEVPWLASAIADGVRGVRFLSLTSAFDSAEGHGYALATEFLRKAGAERGANGPWRAPTIGSGLADAAALALVAASFAQQVTTPRAERVVLLLDPAHISERRAYARWVERAVSALGGTAVKMLAIEDDKERPFEALGATSGRVLTFPRGALRGPSC